MKVYSFSASLTRPADTTTYAAGDVVTTPTTASVMTFTPLSETPNIGCEIKSALLMSSAAQTTKIDAELWLFSATISDLDADNAAFSPTDAQMATLIGIIPFPVASVKTGDATSGAGGNAVCVAANVGLACPVGTLYGVLVVRNAYIPVSGEIFTAILNTVRKY